MRIFRPAAHALTCVAALLLLAGPAAAESDLGIVTGPKTGTYYAFGKDIAQLAARSNLDIDVKPSEGSIDNIRRINSNENAALGIVQSDVLGFLGRSKNPDSIRMASNLRMIFPFYQEEVHVLARKGIKSFADLKDRKVAIGEEGSGNMLTAINLFAVLNIVPGQMLKIPSAQGVVAVLKGDVDAVIFVAGKPVRLFKNLEDLTLPENHKYATMLNEVHFLPLADAKLMEEYRPAEITHDDYSFVDATVKTVSVQAVLVSYDFSQDNTKKGNNKKRCEKLSQLADIIRKGLPDLKEKGHPKWKEVNLDADTGYWKKDACVWPNAPQPPVNTDLLNIIDKK